MFTELHVLYMLYSGLAGAAVLLALHLAKSKRISKIALRALALVTIFIHYSPLWVDYLTTGAAAMRPELLFLLHPCHVCMWLLLISSFLIDRNDVVSRTIKDFVFWGGTVCGAIGTMFNFEFDKNPSFEDYGVLKGLLSHSTMVTGCILLFVAGFVTIRVWSALRAVSAGLLLFGLCGWSANTLFAHFGLGAPNSMYLLEPPFESEPWLTVWTIAAMALTLAFVIAALFEQFVLPREQRWYACLGKWVKKQRPHTKGK